MKAAVLRYSSHAGAFLLTLALMTVSLTAGFASGQNLLASAGLLAVLLAAFIIFAIRFSLLLKVFLLLVALLFVQQVLGFFASEETRGLSAGNLLLAVAVGCWAAKWLRGEKLYKPISIDPWLIIAFVVIPLCSILYTATFRKIPGYSLLQEVLYYKRWVTPFLCFFLVCQCLERKGELRILVFATMALTALAIVCGAPEMIRFSAWEEARSTGILDQANAYAGLISVTAPFFFLACFLLRGQPYARALCLGILGCMALSLLTTYSRAGYIGFTLALCGGVYLAYRGGGRIPLVGPALLLGGIVAVTVGFAPQVVKSVTKRFEISAYNRSRRVSKTEYAKLNQFSGDRLELWSAALQLAKDNPVFGVGYRSYLYLLPRYHRKAITNTPHNQYLGALAEGGIVWLSMLLVCYWKMLRSLKEGWHLTLKRGDVLGQICCGGALVSFVVMLVLGLTSDFLHPSPKGFIFWLLVAAAFKYGVLLKGEEEEEGEACTSAEGAAQPA